MSLSLKLTMRALWAFCFVSCLVSAVWNEPGFFRVAYTVAASLNLLALLGSYEVVSDD